MTPWDQACLQTLKTVAGMPRDGWLTVVLADPAPRVILSSNEPHAGLARRLAEAKPANGAASAAYSLQFAQDLLHGQAGRVLWLTDHPDEKLAQAHGVTVLPVSDPAVLAGSPPQVALLSVVYEPAPVLTDDGQLRVRVGCWGAKDSPPQQLELQASMGSALLPAESGATVLPNSVRDIVVTKVPPHGQVIHLSLKRGTAVEDQADWVAPTLNLPRIKIQGEIPEALRLAALAVGTQATGEEEAAVTLCTSETSAGVIGPAFVVVNEGANQITEPTVVSGVGGMGNKLLFDGARCGVGPDLGARGIPLLMAGSQVVAVLDPNLGGAGVRLYLSSALFAAGSEVPRRPAFFSLVSRYVIQFAQARVNPPTLAGPQQTTDPLYAQAQQANILLGSRDTMGGFRDDPASTKPGVVASSLSGQLQFYEWLLLGAVLLLGVETILYVRGRIV